MRCAGGLNPPPQVREDRPAVTASTEGTAGVPRCPDSDGTSAAFPELAETIEEWRLSDPQRLRALRTTGLLESRQPVPALDRLTRLASRLLGTKVAAVTILDEHRQVMASSVGVGGPWLEQGWMPISRSICRTVVEGGEPLIIRDAREQESFKDHLAVVEDDVVAYAGFPLRTPDGTPLGAFCVASDEPRHWGEAELELMADLTGAAEAEVAALMAERELSSLARRVEELIDGTLNAFVSVAPSGRVIGWNGEAARLLGWSANEALGRDVTDLFVPQQHRGVYVDTMSSADATGRPDPGGQRLELTAIHRDGHEFPIELTVQTTGVGEEQLFHASLHDISERKAAQARLERERIFLTGLLDSLDTGVAACDEEGRLVFSNRALRVMPGPAATGVEPVEWSAECDVFGPDGKTPLHADEAPLARAAAGAEVEGQQLVVRAPGLAARRYTAAARPIRCPDGSRLGAVVVMHDITREHRAQRLRTAQTAAALALADVVEPEEAVAHALAGVGEAMGWPRAEFHELDDQAGSVGPTHTWSSGPLAAAPGAEPGELLGLGGTSFDPQHRRVLVPVLHGSTQVGALVFWAPDETGLDPELTMMLETVAAHLGRRLERSHAQTLSRLLEKEREVFRHMLARISDHVWTSELRPGGQVVHLYASPNGRALVGDDTDSTGQGPPLEARVHPDDRAAFVAFQRSVFDGEPAEVEVRLVGVDGVERWVWARGLPRSEGGRRLLDGIASDVTERHRILEQREQLLAQEQEHVRRLQQVDQLRDEFVTMAGHELRTPLTVIQGYAELALSQDVPTATLLRGMWVIHQRAQQMGRLVADLFDLAQLGTGSITIETETVEVDGLIGAAVAGVRSVASDAQLEVGVEVEPTAVTGDPVRLRQVLDNLLSNAVKYTPAGGRVDVRCRRTPSGVEVTVEDTGIGVPEEQLPHLFDKFFRASTAVVSELPGTGLSLAVTAAVVRAHGGTISAEPNPVGGTIFKLALPKRGPLL